MKAAAFLAYMEDYWAQHRAISNQEPKTAEMIIVHLFPNGHIFRG